MAYVINHLKKTREELDVILREAGDNVTFEHLIMVDYFYHNQNADYDDGLSFLDRLNKKIGRFHQDWDIELMKEQIIYSKYPIQMYLDTIQNMLRDRSDIAYYGV